MKGARGFTLMEVVVTSLIVAVAMVALLSVFLSGLMMVETGRSTVMASADARVVFEEVRRLSGTGGLAAVTQGPAGGWTAWARQEGLISLTNETVTVTSRVQEPNVLEATVTIAWVERGRNRNSQLTGLVTPR